MVRVVVVEDERVLRQSLVLTTPWERFGCVVIGEAANGIEGTGLIEKVRPDIVITDIRMPGCTGIEMIGRLQHLAGIQYIIVSGYAEFAYAQEALTLGVRAYVLKPIDEEQLERALLRAVQAVERRRRREQPEAAARAEGEAGRVAQAPAAPAPGPPHAVDYRERYLAQALGVIGRHYAEPLLARDVAGLLGIGESTFSHLFRARTGYTFLQYLTRYRLKKAVELLSRRQVRVGEVAAMVGYRDFRHFGGLFKRAFGITPLQYRKGLGATAAEDEADPD